VKSLKDRVIDNLLKKGTLTESALKRALDKQKEKGGRLSDILVSMGLLSQKDIMMALSAELKIPPIQLSKLIIDPEITKAIPKKVAFQYKIMPISKVGDILTVAMSDPLNIFAIDDIKLLTGCNINTVITSPEEMADALTKYYQKAEEGAFDDLVKKLDGAKNKGAGGMEVIAQESVFDGESAGVADAPVVKVTDMLLSESIRKRASDILIEPLLTTLRIRYRVDGILQEGQFLPVSLASDVVTRIKVMAELNTAEKRLPQDGRFRAKAGDSLVDFRISIIPASFGEKVAIRVLDRSQAILDIERLGFESAPLELMKKVAKRPHGMILVCGPTGCGKTTTLYSILRLVDSPKKNLVSAEDPVEFELKGINQVTARPSIGLTFAAALRSMLRQDPDVIMVGEIRDFETVDIAVKAALTGHLVLSTLHTTTASGAVVRLVNMGVEPFLISSSILLVAAQRLMRKLCTSCRKPYELPQEAAKKLNIPMDKTPLKLFKAEGCPDCANTGYNGRVGLIEAFAMTPEIKGVILKQEPEHKLRALARQQGMQGLRENGLTKAINGVTSLEEVIRVTMGDV